jgi:hypothetical protein
MKVVSRWAHRITPSSKGKDRDAFSAPMTPSLWNKGRWVGPATRWYLFNSLDVFAPASRGNAGENPWGEANERTGGRVVPDDRSSTPSLVIQLVRVDCGLNLFQRDYTPFINSSEVRVVLEYR